MLTTLPQAASSEAVNDTQSVLALSLRGLPQMLDPERRLFCFRMLRTPQGMIREGISQRYTAMTLLGLHRAEAAGFAAHIDANAIFDALVEDKQWIDNAGDLGLLLWLSAVVFPSRLDSLCQLTETMMQTRFDVRNEERTMETAWLLSGISHAVIADPANSKRFRKLAASAYESLCSNQGESGLFGHKRAASNPVSAMRDRIGSFADQVYPTYAMAHAALAFNFDGSMARSLSCAKAICARQGSLGQWWWHYEAASGRVVGRYPVYSVHQDGMAPMALFAASEASGVDFTEPIYRGLQWIPGDNELAADMRDETAGVIWRNIRTSGFQKYSEAVVVLMSRKPIATDSDLNFNITYECRPYELGWALYGLAGR
ncbi:MAG TPA: hypothetical protein VH437_05905 [Terriglobales bacterium]|jgi:hypothetical protein